MVWKAPRTFAFVRIAPKCHTNEMTRNWDDVTNDVMVKQMRSVADRVSKEDPRPIVCVTEVPRVQVLFW